MAEVGFILQVGHIQVDALRTDHGIAGDAVEGDLLNGYGVACDSCITVTAVAQHDGQDGDKIRRNAQEECQYRGDHSHGDAAAKTA